MSNDISLAEAVNRLREKVSQIPETKRELTQFFGFAPDKKALKKQEEAQIAEKEQRRLFELVVQTLALEESAAMEVSSFYEEWTPGKAYTADQIVRFGVNEGHEPQLFKVIQAHTSQEGWIPPAVPALFKKVGFVEIKNPGGETKEYHLWTQPLGGHDAYSMGEKVSHNGQIWTSDCDNNVWEPGIYGWSPSD